MGADVRTGVLGARSFTARCYSSRQPTGAQASWHRSGCGQAARRWGPWRRGRVYAGSPSSSQHRVWSAPAMLAPTTAHGAAEQRTVAADRRPTTGWGGTVGCEPDRGWYAFCGSQPLSLYMLARDAFYTARHRVRVARTCSIRLLRRAGLRRVSSRHLRAAADVCRSHRQCRLSISASLHTHLAPRTCALCSCVFAGEPYLRGRLHGRTVLAVADWRC